MNEHTQPKSRERTFSWVLVSFYVVVASVLILGGLLGVRRAAELSKRSACLVNVRAIGAAIQNYSRMHQVFPGPDPLGALVAAKLVDANHTRCPDGGAYIVIPPSKQVGADSDPCRLVAYEPASNHREVVNALFADGHAESIRADAFQLPK